MALLQIIYRSGFVLFWAVQLHQLLLTCQHWMHSISRWSTGQSHLALKLRWKRSNGRAVKRWNARWRCRCILCVCSAVRLLCLLQWRRQLLMQLHSCPWLSSHQRRSRKVCVTAAGWWLLAVVKLKCCNISCAAWQNRDKESTFLSAMRDMGIGGSSHIGIEASDDGIIRILPSGSTGTRVFWDQLSYPGSQTPIPWVSGFDLAWFSSLSSKRLCVFGLNGAI